nr:hypothetical protein BaRGS_002780 [Batillaria attramentaria]
MYENNTSAGWFSVSENAHGSSENARSNDTATVTGERPFVPWDNPDNLMTLKQRDLLETITNCVLNPILLLVGVPTNIISCLVFYKQGLRDRMNLCLFVLALVDTGYLLSYFLMTITTFLKFWDEDFREEYGVNVASACITMVIAVERCVCVVYPLRANSIMRTRTMGALLTAIVIISNLGYSIGCIRTKVIKVYDQTTGKTFFMLDINDFFKKYSFVLHDIVYTIIFSFLVPIVTFVVVGVATAITVTKLRTAIAWRASTSSGRGDNHSQLQQMALTKMLVILSCVFMACSAPMTAHSIVRLLVRDFATFGRYSNLFSSATEICLLISLINSGMNFFVYYNRSSRFKVDVRALFLCCHDNTSSAAKSGAETATAESQ